MFRTTLDHARPRSSPICAVRGAVHLGRAVHASFLGLGGHLLGSPLPCCFRPMLVCDHQVMIFGDPGGVA